jgi:predicted PurR-regulated permease PerM
MHRLLIRDKPRNLARDTLVVGAVLVAFVLFLFLLREVVFFLLVAFAGILLGVLLDGATRPLSEHTRLPRAISLTLVLLMLIAAAGGLILLIGPAVVDQALALQDQIPRAWDTIREYMTTHEWTREIWSRISQQGGTMSFDALGKVTGAFSTVFGAVVNTVIIVFLGIYFAYTPDVYINGLMRLLPNERRGRARKVITILGSVLRRWLAARLTSMAVIAVLTGVGLLIIGVKMALALALIAGILAFIPYVGPVLSLLPAIMVALPDGFVMVALVGIIYGTVQALESYIITPLVEKMATSVPPAVLIMAQITMGVLAGGLGILIATPLAVLVMVLVLKLYVEDMLGEKVAVVGEEASGEE